MLRRPNRQADMTTALQILRASGVRFQPFSNSAGAEVYLTEGLQLVGSYGALKDFRQRSPDYSGWQAHHIVEIVDLERLGVTSRFPGIDGQICVLIPERAHIGRVNSILRRENPLHLSATARELLTAYRSAYSLIGDYCGGGAGKIRRELMAIVGAVFAMAGVAQPGV
jgi:hypothetical protein